MVQDRVTVLRDGSGEDHDLIQLAHAFEKGIDAGAFDDVDVVILTLDLDGQGEVRLVKDLAYCQHPIIYRTHTANSP